MSPCPRILMGREAPSGAQPQEPADRARYPESPRRGPRVLRTLAPGSPPLRRRSDPPPSLRQRLGRTPKETGSRSRMVGGVHWQERKPLAPSRRFGVPREHVSPNLPSPPTPNSGPRAQPGVSRWGGPTPGSVSCRALHSPRGVCAPGGAGRPGALGGSAPRDLAPRHAQATGQPRRALSGGRTQSAERPGSGRRSATK